MPFTFEMPERMPDAPPPSSTGSRRIELPDGEHWIEARGGGTQREGAFLNYYWDALQAAQDKRVALRAEPTPDPQAIIAANEASDAASRDVTAAFATFLADRITDHNLTDVGGEKLPLGIDLFVALPAMDAIALCWRIQTRPSFFADPKAGATSSGG